jgi:hypothetical protein
MKAIVVIALFLVSTTLSCKKEKNETCETNLEITKVSIDAYGANLCYSFKQLSISKSADKTYDIKVIGNIPCKPAVCALALYQVSPSGTINAISAGTYTLRFYNGTSLFTTLTVTI